MSKADLDFTIRPATASDADQLLELMKELAIFEDYIQDFRVTREDLLERGFGHAPQFAAKVATIEDTLHGMAVFYHIPYTYDLRPKVVLKELYVRTAMRGKGIGQALMQSVLEFSQTINAASLTWSVMKGNYAAKMFYRDLGGRPDPKWDRWVMPIKDRS